MLILIFKHINVKLSENLKFGAKLILFLIFWQKFIVEHNFLKKFAFSLNENAINP